MTRNSQRLPRGFRPTSGHTQALKGFHRTSPARSVGAMVLDLGAITLLAGLGIVLFQLAPISVSALAHLAIFALIARFQRGLESMVHEGSHWNICRKPRWVNDLLTNVFAAVPTGSTVEDYRRYHHPHHVQFGDPSEDTDLIRYKELEFDDIDRSSITSYVKSMLSRMGPYALSWWKALGTSPLTLALTISWHVLFVIAPIWLVTGWETSVLVWSVYWLLPFAMVLPFVRFVGESGEHDYADPANILDATFSNIGASHWFFHPHHDGYHALHHVLPGIPHWALKEAHEYLLEVNAGGFRESHRCRMRVLEIPERDVLIKEAV